MHPGAHARSDPDKPAVVMAGSGRVVSYAELEAGSNRVARLLRDLGLRPGDGIALCMENHPRFFDVCWGAQRAGLYYTAISSRLTTPEVEYIVDDCGARVLFTSRALAELTGPLAARLPGVQARFMWDGTAPGYASAEQAVAAQRAEPIPDEQEGQDMLYSSGTTGRPKGVRPKLSGKPFGTPPPLVRLVAGLYGMDADTVYLSPAPLYHAAPLRFNLAVQRLGGTSIVMEHFEPREALALIERHRVTHSQWVPTHFVRMLKLPPEARGAHDLSSLRCAIHAAAPCPVPVKEQMMAWWGPVLHEYYGGTEGNGLTALGPEEWLAHKGSVGRAVYGKAQVLGPDGEILPPGEIGTIYFSDGAGFRYHNDPEKTAQAYDGRGRSTLGDVGYLDADGYLYLTDRKAHMIISGGVNIYPQEAENVLVTHPRVADVAVIGVPDEEFGEAVKAVVQPLDPGAAGPELERELIEYCRARLSHVKCPRSVDFEPELPRHPTGKLYKRLLKERYWKGHATRIV